MPGPLFFYGTLRDLDLLRAVLGRQPAPGHLALGTAPGFRTVGPAGGYPALVRAPGGRAEGLVLLAVTSFELDLLDAFAAGDYRRAPIPVIVEAELHEIEAYLPVAKVPPAPDWSLAAWRETQKAGALAGDGRTAAELRARLIASRPN